MPAKKTPAKKRPRPKPLPKYLMTEDVVRLVSIPDTNTTSGKRNRAIMEIMLQTGLRSEEVVKLAPGDLDKEHRQVHVRDGKGHKPREIPYPASLDKHLDAWEEVRPDGNWYFCVTVGKKPYTRTIKGRKEKIKGAGKKPYEREVAGRTDKMGSTKPGNQLTTTFLRQMVYRYADRAGIRGPGKKISPHVLRHTYATNQLRAGMPIRHLQEVLGHGSLTVTEVYLHVAPVHIEEHINTWVPPHERERDA